MYIIDRVKITSVCQYPDCPDEAIECRNMGTLGSDPPDEYLCPVHARDAGYCWICGDFWAGIESFDFSPSGLCEHCQAELDDDDEDDDTGEYDEDDDDEADWVDEEEDDEDYQ